MQVRSDEQSNKKQQVFSHYDETPLISKNRPDSISSNPNDIKNKVGNDQKESGI